MGWMVLWWIVGALLILALIWTVMRGGHVGGAGHDSAEDILNRRYAAGEIDRETFERMRSELRHHS